MQTIASRVNNAQRAQEWERELEGFRLTLEVGQRSERTIEIYEEAVRQLHAFLVETMELDIAPEDVSGEHVLHYLRWVQSTRAPATTNQRYRSLNRFFGYLVKEDVRTDNPMAKIDTPQVPEKIIPTLSIEQIRRIISACSKDFTGLRDVALIRTLLDSGLRVSEALTMTTDMDFRLGIITVVGKGNKERKVRIGERSRQAIHRYLRARDKAGYSDPSLWLNWHGHRLTRHGVLQSLKEAGNRVGIKLWPHLLRHCFATMALEQAAPRDDVQTLLGHASPAMTMRYARSRQVERALAAHQNFSPGDQV